MKRLVVLILVGTMLLTSVVYAADMGVQIISGPEDEETNEPVSLDDLKLDKEVEIDGYGIIKATEYKEEDVLYSYRQGYNSNGALAYKSGETADYVILKMDITNTSVKPKDFLEKATVVVVFDEKYEYQGFTRQFNYDNVYADELYLNGNYSWDTEAGVALDPKNVFIDPADIFSIEPMYEGYYLFGCTLPNKVVKGTEPLSMKITLDGNEITYNIRK